MFFGGRKHDKFLVDLRIKSAMWHALIKGLHIMLQKIAENELNTNGLFYYSDNARLTAPLPFNSLGGIV